VEPYLRLRIWHVNSALAIGAALVCLFPRAQLRRQMEGDSIVDRTAPDRR
jgi:hypothetical protein